MSINKGISYYKGKRITDYTILKEVGCITYAYLQRLYPGWYLYYDECNINYQGCDFIPSILLSYLDSSPLKVKTDLVMLICGEKLDSSSYDLIASSYPPKSRYINGMVNNFAWFFFYLFVIILIYVALVFTLTKKNIIRFESLPN